MSRKAVLAPPATVAAGRMLVILGGLTHPTLFNMLVVATSFLKWGQDS